MPPKSLSNKSAANTPPSNENKRKRTDEKDIKEKNTKKAKASEQTQAKSSHENTLEEAEGEVLALQRTFYRAQADLETRKLRSAPKMPEFIRPFLDSISVYAPAQVTSVQRKDGPNYSALAFECIKTVYRIGNPDDANKFKLLDVDGECWSSNHDKTQCYQRAMDVWYENPGGERKRHGCASAKYFDNWTMSCPYSHESRGVKEIMLDVISDMGYTGEVEDEELVRFLYLLVGVMRSQVMRQALWDGNDLYKIIRDDLKAEENVI